MDESVKNELKTEIVNELRQEQKKKKKRKWLILLLLLLLFLITGVFFVFRYRGGSEADRLQKEVDADVGILPGMSEEEIQDRLNRNVAEGRLNISINPTPEYANGKAAGNIRIENIKGNKYSFVVSVSCIGASDDAGAKDYVGQTVLTTGLIDPDSYVENKKLDVDLPKGEYTCVATFTAYKTEVNEETGQEEEKAVGSAGTQILITVKE